MNLAKPVCCARHRLKKKCRATKKAAAKVGSPPNTACCRAQPTPAAIAKPHAANKVVALKKLGERTIHLDCDVLQADGGTRTASITGAFVAAQDAVNWLMANGKLSESPILDRVAAISVGLKDGTPLLDLDYPEDSACDTDMNVVMTGAGHFVEVQGTAEGMAFTRTEMDRMLALAEKGIAQLVSLQKQADAERKTLTFSV